MKAKISGKEKIAKKKIFLVVLCADMIDKEQIMPLNYFNACGIFTGEHLGMRYRIAKTGEKPDFVLTASVWQAPYAYGATAKENITDKEFECNEQGRVDLIDWLLQMYEERKSYWEEAPSILAAPIDVAAIYKREE